MLKANLMLRFGPKHNLDDRKKGMGSAAGFPGLKVFYIELSGQCSHHIT